MLLISLNYKKLNYLFNIFDKIMHLHRSHFLVCTTQENDTSLLTCRNYRFPVTLVPFSEGPWTNQWKLRSINILVKVNTSVKIVRYVNVFSMAPFTKNKVKHIHFHIHCGFCLNQCTYSCYTRFWSALLYKLASVYGLNHRSVWKIWSGSKKDLGLTTLWRRGVVVIKYNNLRKDMGNL